ncbi:hypothetical protein ACTFIV_002837 [Dictyostelium citrinum]
MNYKLLLVAIITFLALMSSNQICIAEIESDHKACIKQCLKDHGCSDDNGKEIDKSECIKWTFKCPKESTGHYICATNCKLKSHAKENENLKEMWACQLQFQIYNQEK